MYIKKKHLDDMKRCYCASSIEIDGEHHLLFASEDPEVVCEKFSGEDFNEKEVMWKAPGGCMSIIPIPHKEKEFLAVQEFYLKVTPSKAKIVWGKYIDGVGWTYKDVLHLPYIHRFDIYYQDGIHYFIGATIATSKSSKDDWSKPGKIYVGIIPDNLEEGIQLEVLYDGLYRNHGYWHAKENEKDVGYFGSDQGILRVVPPYKKSGKWCCEKIMDGQIGEIATIDIDHDGIDEIMTIEAFHGNQINIYKKEDNGYKKVYQYANTIDFAHTLFGAKIAGKNTFLAGVRRENAELFCVQYIDGKYETTIIDQGVGPANICVVHEKDRDLIVAANHTANEAAVYIVTE